MVSLLQDETQLSPLKLRYAYFCENEEQENKAFRMQLIYIGRCLEIWPKNNKF